MRLRTFNQLDRPLAVTLLRSCLDADRWVEEVVDRRPFTSLEALLETARRVSPLSAPEVERICSTLWDRAVVSSPVVLAGSPLPRPQPETSATAQLAETAARLSAPLRTALPHPHRWSQLGRHRQEDAHPSASQP
jgi:hypothetical protein